MKVLRPRARRSPLNALKRRWRKFGPNLAMVTLRSPGRAGGTASKLVATRSRSAPQQGPKKTGAIAPATYTGSIRLWVSNLRLEILQNALENIHSRNRLPAKQSHNCHIQTNVGIAGPILTLLHQR